MTELERLPFGKDSYTNEATTEFARAYGSLQRVKWMECQPSIVSGNGPCVNAHIKNGGISRKADARFIVPLTNAEHNEFHQDGRDSFEQKYNVDLGACAAEIQRRWEQFEQHTSHPTW